MIELFALTSIGFAAGMVAGIFGVGGGVVFVPALSLVAGLSHLEAQATSLAALVPVVIVGAWRQHRHGNLDVRAALAVGLASAGGVAAGTAIATSLPEDTLKTLFAALLLVVAAQLLWSLRRPSRSRQRGADDYPGQSPE